MTSRHRQGSVLIIVVALLTLLMALAASQILSVRHVMAASHEAERQAQAYLLLQGARIILNEAWARPSERSIPFPQVVAQARMVFAGMGKNNSVVNEPKARDLPAQRIKGLGWYWMEPGRVMVMVGNGWDPNAVRSGFNPKSMDLRYYATTQTDAQGRVSFSTVTTIPTSAFAGLWNNATFNPGQTP